ncbi:MAG: RimK family protein [Gemmatimonadota bacterium]
MAEHLVLVERREDWQDRYPDVRIATADEYLSGIYADLEDLRLLNLCRSYRYLSVGYYCSLLAEARLHKVVPAVRTINELSRKSMYRLEFEDLEEVVESAFERHSPEGPTLDLDVFFGHCSAPEFARLARALAGVYRVPLLRATFRLRSGWRLESLRPLHIHQLEPAQESAFLRGLEGYFSDRWRKRRSRARRRYDLAILFDPKEKLPPSNRSTLEAFARAGRAEGLNVDFIQKRDYPRLAEYDALFIRETTAINHHTYRFAKKAENEGLVVIDDPDSILVCTNKVYLSEILKENEIPAPKTLIVRRRTLDTIEAELSYPVVLKIPDGSFSLGVHRAANADEVRRIADELFETSDLILAQEYLYTPFDWRIGVLNGEPLYACQYFMSRAHWQIIHHQADGRSRSGGFKTFAVEDVPAAVIRVARRAARLMGRGLYGVDLKQVGRRSLVIEVNDNPSITLGVEDAILKSRLFRTIMGEFVRRLDARR